MTTSRGCVKIPGKTFLAGEYLALVGGPSLVIATKPLFLLKYQIKDRDSNDSDFPFHSDSPAGALIKENKKILEGLQINFDDPYPLGGMGASTAQFLGIYRLIQQLKASKISHSTEGDLNEMLKQYISLSSLNGKAPSGADLIGLSIAGVTYFERNNFSIFKFNSWPFKELGFQIFHTKNKIKTHEHLNSLNLAQIQNLKEDMTQVVNGILQSMKDQMPERFLTEINKWQEQLKAMGFLAQHSDVLIQKIKAIPQVKGAKACGALGSDTLIVFTHPRDTFLIKDKVQEMGLTFIASQDDLYFSEINHSMTFEMEKSCEH